MRYLLIIVLYCSFVSNTFGQGHPSQQQFVIKKERIIDHENIFTAREIQQLDSIVTQCWEQGIAEIAVITIDERHTDNENFDQYVLHHLTSYAQGAYGKNNGVVIALSTKLRQMRIQNGYGTESLLSNEETKKIIDEVFIPQFKEGKYFEGMMRGLNVIIQHLREAMKETDFTHASAIFSPSMFNKITLEKAVQYTNGVSGSSYPTIFGTVTANGHAYKVAYQRRTMDLGKRYEKIEECLQFHQTPWQDQQDTAFYALPTAKFW